MVLTVLVEPVRHLADRLQEEVAVVVILVIMAMVMAEGPFILLLEEILQ